MKTLICDRCGKDNIVDRGRGHFGERDFAKVRTSYAKEFELDLCPDCYEALRKFMNEFNIDAMDLHPLPRI